MSDTTNASTSEETATKRTRRMAREPELAAVGNLITAAPVKRPNKTDLVLDLLKRPKGATIPQLVEATGWLPPTTRAALTGLKKKGHVVTSEKVEGLRHYRIDAGAA